MDKAPRTAMDDLADTMLIVLGVMCAIVMISAVALFWGVL